MLVFVIYEFLITGKVFFGFGLRTWDFSNGVWFETHWRHKPIWNEKLFRFSTISWIVFYDNVVYPFRLFTCFEVYLEIGFLRPWCFSTLCDYEDEEHKIREWSMFLISPDVYQTSHNLDASYSDGSCWWIYSVPVNSSLGESRLGFQTNTDQNAIQRNWFCVLRLLPSLCCRCVDLWRNQIYWLQIFFSLFFLYLINDLVLVLKNWNKNFDIF